MLNLYIFAGKREKIARLEEMGSHRLYFRHNRGTNFT